MRFSVVINLGSGLPLNISFIVVEKQEIKVEPEKKVVSPSKGESHAKKNEGNNVKNNVNADKNVKKEEVVEAEPVQKSKETSQLQSIDTYISFL